LKNPQRQQTDADSLKKIFGARVREARKSAGLSQAELGAMLGADKTRVSHYESGSSTPPFDGLVALATTLDVSLDWLCGRTDTPHPLGKGGETMDEDRLRTLEAAVRQLQDEILRLLALTNVLSDHLAAHGLAIPWDQVGPRFRQALAQEARRLGIPYVPDAAVAAESLETWEAYLQYRLGVEFPPAATPEDESKS